MKSPVCINDIFCQDSAIDSLQQAYAAGRMAQSYIFAGKDGVGRAAAARLWAKMLLCENPVKIRKEDKQWTDCCGKCPSCLLMDSGNHPDYKRVYKELLEFTKEGKGKGEPSQMPVDVIREFLIDKVASSPQMGRWVVFVVEEAEKVNVNSQNAMLKALEEPPAHCVIILLSNRPDAFLPTILSRCRLIRFGDIDRSKLAAVLKENGVSAPQAAFLASFCEGSLGQALTMSSLQHKDVSAYDIKRQLVEKLAELTLGDALDIAEWMTAAVKTLSSGMQEQQDYGNASDITRRARRCLIRMVITVLVDVMRASLGQNQDVVNSDQLGLIQKIAAKTDPETAAKGVLTAANKLSWIDSNVNEKLIFEGLLLNLTNSDILSPLLLDDR